MIVELEDRFTSPMAGATAATARFRKGVDDAGKSTVVYDRTVKDTSSTIDKFSGRLSILARAAAALGPGFVPITTAAIPAVTGLATQLGFAAAAGGTAVLAFNGVGDALGALNQYQLEPSAENFAKLQEEMKGLGPAAREFVFYLDEIAPQLQTIREAAQEGLLPGVQEGIDSLLERLPQVRRIISEIATTTGDLFAGAGAELASSEWDTFFNFLEAEARPALTSLGQTVGNVAKGVAELWMAMDPLSDDFTEGLLEASAAFEQWAEGVSKTKGFQEFLAYVRETGPQVLETIGSVANALLQVAEAAAPLGGPVLNAIEGVADALAAIANSPAGPPLMAAAAAMSALSLASRGLQATMGTSLVTTFADLRKEGKGVATSAAGAAKGFRGLGLATAGLVGLSYVPGWFEDIHHAVDETLPGVEQLTGRIMALGDGRLPTLGAEFYNLAESIRRITDRTTDESINDALQAPFEGLFGEAGTLRQARAEIDKLDQAFARMVGLVGSEQAQAAFQSFAQNQGLSAKQTRTLLNLMPGYREALAGAANAARAHGRETDKSTVALDKETQAIAENLTAMRERRNAALAAENAEIAYQAAIDDARRSLKENGKTLDITTEKGRNNRQALLNLAGAWNNQSDAAKNTKGAHEAAIDTFVRVAKRMGMNEGAARRYARQLLEIPPRRHTAVELDKAGAQRSLAAYKAYLGTIPRHIQTTLTVKRVRGGPIIPGVSNADGNVIDYYAAGGLRSLPKIGDQQPQIQPNHGPRGIMWAETGAGPWEAFISGHPAKRERSRNIADEVVSRLGGAVAWKAADGMMLARQAAAVNVAAPNVTVRPDGATAAEVRALRAEVAAVATIAADIPRALRDLERQKVGRS